MTENDTTPDPAQPEDAAAAPGVGAQLRAAREALGLSVDQMAEDTRISTRHIANIDAGRFADLPGKMYAIGFSKTYAKRVGLDQEDVAAMVRAEMGEAPAPAHDTKTNFEPGDPTRAPGRTLVWFSVFAVVLLFAGLFFAARELFAPAGQLPSLIEQEEVEQQAELAAQQAAEEEAAQEIDAAGEVVFTAQGDAWVRFSDAQGRILMEQVMAQGETFTVPAAAEGPTIITARPDLLTITIDGRAVPKLAEEMQTVVDIPVSGTALLARAQPAQSSETAPIASETTPSM